MIDAASALPAIPFRDVREGGTLRHALEGADRLEALRAECLAFFPRAVGAAMPALDALARRWLKRADAPYLSEIEAIAARVGFPGVWFLNGSYQWGCTALAREEDGAPWLARTLDWPFAGLGRHVEVAHMQGAAGDFLSVSWPGYVGTLTAMAPGRFAACINQAPLWRRTRHRWLRTYDMAANAINTWHVRDMPPDQLLRRAFETCADFSAARTLLEQTPLARPVIFVLAGCAAGERCVIERTEHGFVTHLEETAAANDWVAPREGWEARIAAQHFFSLSYEQAGDKSRARRSALHGFAGALGHEGFAWVAPPVLNPYTRIAIAMCPAQGRLRVQGFECAGAGQLPQPATQVRELRGAAASRARSALEFFSAAPAVS